MKSGLLCGFVFGLTLVTLVDSRKLPFGARMGIRKVRVKAKTTTQTPVLIDWSNFGNFLRQEKSLSGQYLPPPASDDNNVYEENEFEPGPGRPIENGFDIPEIDPPVIEEVPNDIQIIPNDLNVPDDSVPVTLNEPEKPSENYDPNTITTVDTFDIPAPPINIPVDPINISLDPIINDINIINTIDQTEPVIPVSNPTNPVFTPINPIINVDPISTSTIITNYNDIPFTPVADGFSLNIVPTSVFNDFKDIPFTFVSTISASPVINDFSDIPFTSVADVPSTEGIISNVQSQRQCQIVVDTIYDQIEETSCSIVNKETCSQTPGSGDDCYVTLEDQCQDVVETQVQEVCSENLENVCEDVLENFTRNVCEFVNQTKCEEEYETQLKDECTYETVYEDVCSQGYLISYEDECDQKDNKETCKKIPKYPTKQCRKVPRIEGKCKKVPVLRPNKCIPVERVVCQEVPYQQVIKKCVATNRPICRQQPVEIVKNICNIIERETCTLAGPIDANNCQTLPENVCETKLVPFTRKIEREVCNNNNFETLPFSEEFYTTTF